MTPAVRITCDFLKRRFFMISWISLVIYLFYDTFTFYLNGRQFYFLRNILGLGLCISRGTASVLNLCGALILLPLCKKLNQVLYKILSKFWPGLFFFWLEKAKSFHMTVAITLLVFAVVHSISHFVNLWNFSRGYDESIRAINLAHYKNESPFSLLLNQAGLTGVSMLLIIITMGLSSMRPVRRRLYNAFWYTHQLYLVFLVLLIVHPLSGVLKEEVLNDDETSQHPRQPEELWANNSFAKHKFVSIKSTTWLWMVFPLSCFFVDLLWRVCSRNRVNVPIIEVSHMAGRTVSLTLGCPHDQFEVRMGQYVLLQCLDVSLMEWHPFTVVRVPTSSQRDFVIWIRVKGDWTESLENLLLSRSNRISIFVDGPFSSPMEHASQSKLSLCVGAGVGITPFVCLLHHMFMNPRSKLPGRVHLIWIVRHEQEISWLADLANKTIRELRNANRPDRLHLEFYVTNTNNNEPKDSNNKAQNGVTHMVVINEKGRLCHMISKGNKKAIDEDKARLLTPNIKRHAFNDVKNSDIKVENSDYNIAKEYPLLGCRIRRGRPHWDKVFGYWVHLYPQQHLNVYCCGTKKLVKTLRKKCNYVSRTTKNRFTFIHEGFS